MPDPGSPWERENPNDGLCYLQAAQVPLAELLRKIPADYRAQWEDGGGFQAWHTAPVGRYCHEAATTILSLQAENADLKTSVVAFGGPWAAAYAKDFGLAEGELHPTHYDILAAAGARMDDFKRASLTETDHFTGGRGGE